MAPTKIFLNNVPVKLTHSKNYNFQKSPLHHFSSITNLNKSAKAAASKEISSLEGQVGHISFISSSCLVVENSIESIECEDVNNIDFEQQERLQKSNETHQIIKTNPISSISSISSSHKTNQNPLNYFNSKQLNQTETPARKINQKIYNHKRRPFSLIGSSRSIFVQQNNGLKDVNIQSDHQSSELQNLNRNVIEIYEHEQKQEQISIDINRINKKNNTIKNITSRSSSLRSNTKFKANKKLTNSNKNSFRRKSITEIGPYNNKHSISPIRSSLSTLGNRKKHWFWFFKLLFFVEN